MFRNRKVLLGAACAASLSAGSAYAATQYPDMRAVVPSQLQVQGSSIYLRFSTGIANTGLGRLELHPVNGGSTTTGIQWLYDEDGQVVEQTPVSAYAYHPAHHHWHLGDVALFELHQADSDGLIGALVGNSVKVTFCLIDWGQIDENNVAHPYFKDCGENALQGISPGWIDVYHHSTPGQSLPLPTVEGDYYLVNKVNPEGHFIESDLSNNTAWVKFRLELNGSGFQLTELATYGIPANNANR